MTHITERPKIKDYFKNVKKWEDVHKVYVGNKALFNYTKDLDFYIDHLEQENKETIKEIEKLREESYGNKLYYRDTMDEDNYNYFRGLEKRIKLLLNKLK